MYGWPLARWLNGGWWCVSLEPMDLIRAAGRFGLVVEISAQKRDYITRACTVNADTVHMCRE